MLANGLHDGAVYLAGYALELALKARICKLLDSDYPQGRGEFQSFLMHNYGTLVRLAGLEKQLDEARLAIDFAENWSVLADDPATKGWSETWRYRRIGSVSQADAEEIIAALDNPSSGILPWIHSLW